MKKVISIILCVLMLLSCVPAAVLAETVPETGTVELETRIITETQFFESHKSYVIGEGCTVTIESNTTVNIPLDCTLTVAEGGTLVVNGGISVAATGEVIIDGNVVNGQKIKNEEGGSVKVRITYNSIADYGAAGKIDSIECYYGDSTTSDIAKELKSISELNENKLDIENGGSFYFDLGKVIFVKPNIHEPTPEKPRFDVGKYMVYFRGVGISYEQGYWRCAVGNSGELGFSQWNNDIDFYKMCKIQLPSGEGYEVIGRDMEISSDGTVTLPYGQPFAFKVEVDEAYDMSYYEVYIFNGYGFLNIDPKNPGGTVDIGSGKILSLADFAAKCDEEGYYTIPSLVGDTTVSVVGITKNETITMIGDIIDAIRNIFNMIKEFFQGIMDAFKGIGE